MQELENELIIMKKPLNNIIISPNESKSLLMSDYFQGNLLKYELDCDNIQKPKNESDWETQTDYGNIIQMGEPFKILHRQRIKDPLLFDIDHEPLPRMTLLEQNFWADKTYFAFVDRNLTFYLYHVLNYAEGDIKLLQKVYLDKTIVNDTCTDMHVDNGIAIDLLVLFCKSKIYYKSDSSGQINQRSVNVIVSLNNFIKNPQVDYQAYIQDIVIFDHRAGVKVMGSLIPTIATTIYLGHALNSNGVKKRAIISYDGLQQKKMFIFDQKYQYFEKESEIMGVRNYIDFDESFEKRSVLDYLIISNILKTVAVFLFDNVIVICGVNKSVYFHGDMSNINCDKDNGEQYNVTSGLTLYYNKDDTNFLFVTQSYPPGVTELDISDYSNVIPVKIYKPPNEQPTHIGLSTIAINNNYIVHLMMDIENNQQFFRLYHRQGTRYETCKLDFYLQQNTRIAYLAFPNFYFNGILFRDEKTIIIQQYLDYSIQFDGKEERITKKYWNNIFKCKLKIQNDVLSKIIHFNITFVNKNYTKIHSLATLAVQEQKKLDPIKILYNCGDFFFEYNIQDLFIGPNFDIKITNEHYDLDNECDDGSCYFQLSPYKLVPMFQGKMIDLGQCTHSYIFPPMDNSEELNSPYSLICVQLNITNIIQSYQMIINEIDFENGKFALTNQIQLPQQKIDYSFFDLDNRSVFFIYKSDKSWNLNNVIISFFSIDKTIIWQKDQIIQDIYFKEISKISSIKYNQDLNMGVLISNLHLYSMNQTVIVFSINYEKFELTIVSKTNITLQENQTCYYDQIPEPCTAYIKNALIMSEKFVLIELINDYLSIYQIIKDWYQSITLTRLKTIQLKIHSIVRSLDILDQKYLVIFYLNLFIEVYEIRDQIDLSIKFMLPFYNDYNGYTYVQKSKQGFDPQRSYYKGYLSFLIQDKKDPDNDEITKQEYLNNFNYKKLNQRKNYTDATKLLVFCLKCESQYELLTLSLSFSEFFQNSSFRKVVLFGDNYINNIALVSEDKLYYYQTVFETKLLMNKKLQNKLIEKCQNMSLFPINEKISTLELDENKLITKLYLKAFSNILSLSNSKEAVEIQVFSYNQGFATQKKQGDQSIIYSTYQEDKSQQNNSFLVQDLISGFSLNYKLNCTYYDSNGNIEDCNSNVIDETKDSPFKFYIEFVTANRQVTKSINLGKYVLLFDSLQQWHLLRFGDGENQSLENLNGRALDIVDQGDIIEYFGCQINGFFEPFTYQQNDNFEIVLAIYQCKGRDGTKYLRVASIILYQQKVDNKYLEIKLCKNQYRVPFDIIDIDRSTYYDYVLNDDHYLQVMIGISCLIPNSFTNTVYFLNLTINFDNNTFTLESKNWISSVIVQKNTFKVERILRIDQSELLIITDRYNGGYLYDLISQQIVYEFNVEKDNLFYDQYFKHLGPINVFATIYNQPSSIHFLTNYGIYIYTMNVSLKDRLEIFPEFRKNLKVINQYVIRITFDEYSYDVAANKHGYAFLVKQYTSQTSYDTYLGAVSFFQSTQSKVLKLTKLGKNLDCKSLTYDPYLASHLIDQIAVSFVCNTQLYVVRICTRPHITVDFVNITSNSTSNSIVSQESVQFNMFKISLEVNNTFTTDSSQNQYITILYYFQIDTSSNKTSMYIISFIIVLVIAFVIIIINNCLSQKTKDKRDKAKKFNKLHKLNTLQSQQTTTNFRATTSMYSVSNFDLKNSFESFEINSNKVFLQSNRKQVKQVNNKYDQILKQINSPRHTRNRSDTNIRLNLQTNKIVRVIPQTKEQINFNNQNEDKLIKQQQKEKQKQLNRRSNEQKNAIDLQDYISNQFNHNDKNRKIQKFKSVYRKQPIKSEFEIY